jgi:mRNA interferase MazF
VAERGEVWQIDFGMVQKVRPGLVISVPYGDRDRALLAIVPHTTSLRDSDFEVPILVRFLEPGAFMIQGLVAVHPKLLIRRLGVLSPEQLATVELRLRRWLGLGEA